MIIKDICFAQNRLSVRLQMGIVSELNYPMNFLLGTFHFFTNDAKEMAQIVVEIDKRLMFTYYVHHGWCELFDSIYLYAESQVLIEMVIR